MSQYLLPSYENLTGDPKGPEVSFHRIYDNCDGSFNWTFTQKKNSWNVWGKSDEFGTLNHLTDAVVGQAATEIRHGHRIALSLPMDFLLEAPPYRKAFQKNFISKAPRTCNDDEWAFNSQCSSQWDGYRHYGFKERYFMGHSREDFERSPRIGGIQNWIRGISGRGVLVDWYKWKQKNESVGDFLTSGQDVSVYKIPFNKIIEVLDYQGTRINEGDIVLIRTGWVSQYRQRPVEELRKLHELAKRQKPDNVGLEPSDDLYRWLWDSRIAAIAADNKSVEAWSPSMTQPLDMHERVLCGMGMPLGELFDLDELSEHCSSTGRYTFFFSSVPVNVPGAVASPPNAIAIF